MSLFKLKNQEGVQVVEAGYQSFSTPFLKVPGNNLSLPYVDDRYQARGYVPFGEDNLYPQYLNQMYYSSPLHGSIVDFKVNAAIGGGYEFEEKTLTAKQKVDLYAFGKKISIKKTIKAISKDLILHDRCYFLVKVKSGLITNADRVSPEKVRVNKDKTIYSVNDNWQYVTKIDQYTPFKKGCADGTYIMVFENDSVGQDIYPLPQYTSALNFAFLSGELSYLQKANIQNSIFPSFAMMFPKRPQSQEEMELIKQTVNKLKGAENAGKAVAFFANNKEQLPELVNVPTNDNDKLFKEASELITEQLCFAHTIDPILLGVRTTGSLGNGSDIKQAYVIFEKNVIMPLRESVEDVFNTLMVHAGIDTKITIINYQIINETIVEVEGEGSQTIDALNSMSPLVATKVLNMMTINETRALAGLKPIDGGDVILAQSEAENQTPEL